MCLLCLLVRRQRAQAVPMTTLSGLAAAAILQVIAASAMTDNAMTWARLGPKWRKSFLIAADQPHLGSWIDVRLQPWGLGCRVCSETKVSSEWASYSAEGPLQKATLSQHHKSKTHRSAVQIWLKNDKGCSGPAPNLVPSMEDFEGFVSSFDSKTSLTRKELRMAWCVREGVKALDQKFLENAECVSLMRDERNGRIAVRFRAVSPQLAVRSGFLGQARQSGTGSDNISAATWEIMQRACSRFVGAPDGKSKGFLKKKLFKHLKDNVVAMSADSAADEMASSEVMRLPELSLLEDNQAMLPNLQHVFRDRAHASRRLTSRPWNADDQLKEVMNYMGRGPGSMARLINNSMELKRVFTNFSRSSESPVHSLISSFRSAGHRFESYAKPLGRTCLFYHACLRTACHLARSRTDVASQKAKAWLAWISEEHLLQAAMLADAADSSLALTRSLDTENIDPAVLRNELVLYQKEIQSLFVQGKCLTAFGYTSTMCQMLKHPVVFQCGRGMKSLGSMSGVETATINTCLDRMRAWVKLAVAAIEAEFPHFEVMQAFDVFDLRGVKSGSTSDASLKLLAHTYNVDFNSLKSEWDFFYPRAQLLFKQPTKSLMDDTVSKDMSRDANKQTWKFLLEKYSVARLRKAHPATSLRQLLLKYLVCSPSTSGIEQNFSKCQAKYGKQRHHALPQHEELVLKLYCDLPHLNFQEKTEVCKLARLAWAAQYGSPRLSSQPRADKGLKRKRGEDGSERSFVARRRAAAAAAAAASSQDCGDIDTSHWTDKHEKEAEFLKKKTEARKIQAVAESSYLDASSHDKLVASHVRQKFIDNHRKRRKQNENAEEMNRCQTRLAVLSNLKGAKVFLYEVAPSVALLAALGNHGLRITEDPLEATAVICNAPGEVSNLRLQLLVGLRGLTELSPSFLLSGQGCAVKFFQTSASKKVVLVSAAAAEKNKHMWQHFRTCLPQRHGWKMHRMAAAARPVHDLKQKKKEFPKQKTFAVIADDEAADRPEGDKDVVTVKEFVHRIRRADLTSSYWGLSQD